MALNGSLTVFIPSNHLIPGFVFFYHAKSLLQALKKPSVAIKQIYLGLLVVICMIFKIAQHGRTYMALLTPLTILFLQYTLIGSTHTPIKQQVSKYLVLKQETYIVIYK